MSYSQCMEKSKVTVIVVLFVVALFLGVIIFARQAGKQSTGLDSGEPLGVSPGQASFNPDNQPDAVAVLMFPAQDASREALDAHRALVDKLAEKTPYLDITKCAPKPLVFAHTKGEDLMVKNQDTEAGYVVRWGMNEVTVPPGKSIAVKANMIYEPGILGYGCYLSGVSNPAFGTVGVIFTQ